VNKLIRLEPTAADQKLIQEESRKIYDKIEESLKENDKE